MHSLIKVLYCFYQLSKLFSTVELVYQINKIALSSIEGGGTSAFFQILAHGDTGAFSPKFLETICWEIFWKLYAGNLLMETMCWEIWVDAGNLLMGVIMAQCCAITLQFQGNGHPSSADLSRMK